MAQIRSSRWWGGLTTLLVLAFLLAVYLLTFWGYDAGIASADGAGIGPTTSTASTPEPSDAGPPAIPDIALPLTEGVLESVEPGWLLVEYDASSPAPDPAAPEAGASPPPTAFPPAPSRLLGPRRLFVVDRVGTVYEGADLGAASGLELSLWLPDRRRAIVVKPESPGSDRTLLYSFDIVTGEIAGPFDGPGAVPDLPVTAPPSVEPSPSVTSAPMVSSSPAIPVVPAPADPASRAWTSPEIRVSADGESLLVADGDRTRRWTRVAFDGTAVERVVPPVVGGVFVEDPEGGTYVAGEQVTTTGSRWSEEQLEWIPFTERHWNVASYVPVPDGDAEVRVDHGAPTEGDHCAPRSWAPDRQLLVICPGEPGHFSLVFTLALATDTFVRVAQIPALEGDQFFSIKPDATRVAVGDHVYAITGDLAWDVPVDERTPPGFAWSGDVLALWGEAEAAEVGAAKLIVHDAFDGAVVFALRAAAGDAGVVRVVGTP